MTLYMNTCENCETSFEVKSKSQTRPASKAFVKYCSDECRKAGRSKPRRVYINTCVNCGVNFEVYTKQQHDPTKKKKFKRCCSDTCVNEIRSKNIKKLNESDNLVHHTGPRRRLDRDELIRLRNYEHKTHAEIREILKVKHTTLAREFERLQIPREFFRECPQCKESYSVPNRSMVDPNSNKFKKFCSRKCFLSSRNQTNTWIEVEIRDFLKSKDLDFIEQYEVDRMTIDFYLPEANIAIEANGDFWHANPTIYGNTKPLHRIHERVIAKDKRKLKQLNDTGIEVLVVWENDLSTDKNETLETLYRKIKGA